MCCRFDVHHTFSIVRNAPGPLERFVVDVILESRGEHVGRFRIAHEMHAEIDHVEEIDQGTAAGKSFVGEPTSEAGDAGATDPLGLAGVDGADCAVVHVAPHGVAFGTGAVVEVEHQRATGGLGGFLELGHFGGADGRRLFAEHVFAGLHRLQREGGVKLVGDDDRNTVEVGQGVEHLSDVAERFFDAVLRGGFGRGLGVDVRDRDDVSSALAETIDVIGGHAARTDNS